MNQTTYQTDFLLNDRNIKLFHQAWVASNPLASVVIIHGVGEHSGRYEEFARFLNEKQISVYSFDLPGYGKSGGKRGHVKSFSDFTDDVKINIDFIKEKIGDKEKIFLLGHSLGALITIRYVRIFNDVSFSGLILSGPPFQLNLSATSWWRRIGVFFSSILPAITIKEESIQLNMLTHDAEKLAAFRKDPLRHYRRSLQFIQAYFKGEKKAFADGPFLALPVLIVQGGADDVIDVKKVKTFYHQLNIEDKMFIVYPEMYHEVLNEIERARVYDDIVNWIMRRCKKKQ
ncbi:MAG: lysophospholipase [Candidatus Omnitrophica bacterium]|nr:lysophospholipase [Candidatus Omnitrophota bacterium]